MKTTLTLRVNGADTTVEVEPRMSLADLLRGPLRLTATHLGCEHGVCGACSVLIDGALARSCIALAATLDGAEIITLEGLADDADIVRLKTAFQEKHGLQCGFCTPGMLISARDLLRRNPDPDADEIRIALSGNLCRCTGYQGIVRSVLRAAEMARETTESER